MKIEMVLTNAGYKLTKPRLAVFDFLKKQRKLISARDLHAKIKKVDQASVYRTFSLFEELSIVNTEIIGKEKFYCLAERPHHHIICRQCGYNESFPCEEKKIREFKNFSGINHQLTLTGVCNKCK